MASTKLLRAQGTPTNNKIFTISCWFKAAQVANEMKLIYADDNSTNNYTYIHFSDTSGRIRFQNRNSSSNNTELIWENYIRDFSAYYHLVMAVDSTQSTESDRVKFYLNGVQQTTLDSSANTFPPLNQSFTLNSSGYDVEIGASNSSSYFNGLMSYFAFVDGTAYDASYFGETNAATGIWKIKTSPSVTYGTNGFFLKMDTSSPGSDTSGNNNTFTASGTPTLAQDNASNNFTTLNPLNAYYTNSTFSNGNTTFASGSSYSGTTANILLSTGKWYWEGKPISKDGDGDNYVFGIQGQEATGTNQFVGSQAFGWMYYGASGQLYNNNSGASYGDTFTAGDIIGVALDCTNNKLYFSKNGVFQNSENPSAGTGGISITAPASVSLGGYYPSQTFWENSTSGTFSMNFGNGFFGVTAVASSNADAAGHGLFEYAVPTGYYTLNTKNLNTYGG